MKVLEIILAVIFGIGLFFKFNHWPGSNMFITISLTLLAMQYFLLSFIFFNKIKLKNIFKNETYKNIPPAKIIGTIGFGIGLSTLLLGTLYELLHWPGGEINLYTGIILISIIFIISIIKYLKTKSKFYIPIFIRFFIGTLIGIISLNINL